MEEQLLFGVFSKRCESVGSKAGPRYTPLLGALD